MKLKDVDPLVGGHSLVCQQLVESALEAEESRRVGAQAEIHANWADRRSIPDYKSEAVHHVVEVLNVLLAEPEADIANIGKGVAHIVKQYAAEVIADQGEAQLR